MSTEMTQTAPQAERASESTRGVAVYRPPVDIFDTGEGVKLMLEMPGVGRDDVQIDLERRVLTIRGRGRSPAPTATAGSTPNTARVTTSASSPSRRTSTRPRSAPR